MNRETDLTQSLRELAGKFPNLFWLHHKDEYIRWGDQDRQGKFIEYLTSDDLDQIAGLLGKEFYVFPCFKYGGWGWDAEYWPLHHKEYMGDTVQLHGRSYHIDCCAPTKLEASRAALTAIIKEVVK